MSTENSSAHNARGWTLAIASIATFMLMLDVTVVNIALPSLRRSLGASFTDMQWVIDAYTLTLAVFLLSSGSLADRLGRRRIFTIGVIVFSVASLTAGAAQNILALNLSRGVQGVGAAVMFAVGPALIGHEFRGKDRAKAFGVFGGVVGLALALGPVIGGVVINGLSWRWIFLLNVPIGAAVLVATTMRLRESRDPRPLRIDWAGQTTFAAALTLVVLGFLRGESSGWTSTFILSLFVLGIVLFAVFLTVERRLGDAAMLDLSLFRVRTFNGISTATLLSNATSLAMIFLEVLYLQNVLGYSALGAGLRMMPLTLTLFAVAGLTGAIAGKVAPALLVGASIAFIAAGIGLIAIVHPTSSWTALMPSMIVMGIGMGTFNPPRAAVTIGVAEPAKAGMASGIGETFQQVGVAVGVAAFGALFHNEVVRTFITSAAGRRIGSGAEALGRAAATNGSAHLAGATSSNTDPEVIAAARTAFVHGFTHVSTVCAIICAVGAVLAFTLIRSGDLHVSALADASDPVVEVTSSP